MTDSESGGEARPQMRRKFPSELPELSRLDIAALAAWLEECAHHRLFTSRWTPNGFRWRRAWNGAMREYEARLLAHKGVIADVCDHCGSRPATSHVAYKQEAAPRFAHYCGQCAPSMPHGWMFVTSFGKEAKTATVA